LGAYNLTFTGIRAGYVLLRNKPIGSILIEAGYWGGRNILKIKNRLHPTLTF